MRAQMVLVYADCMENKVVAALLRVIPKTWCNHIAVQRLAGLFDTPRSDAPRAIDGSKVNTVTLLTVETVPSNAMYWITRSMARDEVGLGDGHARLARLHRQETF